MTNFNPWHNVPIGKAQPDIVQAIIEIPKGSKAKYELDKETEMLRLDRVLFSSVNYPENYGFILGKPKTRLSPIWLWQRQQEKSRQEVGVEVSALQNIINSSELNRNWGKMQRMQE